CWGRITSFDAEPDLEQFGSFSEVTSGITSSTSGYPSDQFRGPYQLGYPN
ncbi:unnamed protein product, partial [Arabidopsis halleri]